MHYPLNSFGYKFADAIPFIDYGDSGVWVLGLMRPSVTGKDELLGIMDEDVSIESLIERALQEWEISPTDLWISESGGQLTVWGRSGMKV